MSKMGRKHFRVSCRESVKRSSITSWLAPIARSRPARINSSPAAPWSQSFRRAIERSGFDALLIALRTIRST
jgi:hypothetical protein